MTDLVLKGGRVIDPASGHDETADIAFADGKVTEIGRDLPANGAEIVDARGLFVVPGLIDLHTHVYWGGTSLGVDAAEVARRSGTTTFVDAGSAGPGIFHGFRRHVIEPSPLRIIPYLNVSFPGIFAVSAAVTVGECADLRLLDPRECVRVIRANRDLIAGVKVRVGRNAGGASGVAPLDIALEVAEETGLPVMAHLDNPPPSRLEVLTRLRRGDILTHCFRPFPNAPVRGDGLIRDEVLEARRRGVIFDIGHGSGSFGFRTAEAMLTAGFLPDVISSDVHAISIKGPAFDQLVAMSKFLCLEMELIDVIRASTAGPAAALGRTDIGRLEIGAVGDATVLELPEGDFEYCDVLGEVRVGRQRLIARGLVVPGAGGTCGRHDRDHWPNPEPGRVPALMDQLVAAANCADVCADVGLEISAKCWSRGFEPPALPPESSARARRRSFIGADLGRIEHAARTNPSCGNIGGMQRKRLPASKLKITTPPSREVLVRLR